MFLKLGMFLLVISLCGKMLLMTIAFRLHWFVRNSNGTHNYNKIPVSINNFIIDKLTCLRFGYLASV